MLKNEYIEKLCDCERGSFDCPYYDWRYQKCNMLATEGVHPKDQCDEYIGDEEVMMNDKRTGDQSESCFEKS